MEIAPSNFRLVPSLRRHRLDEHDLFLIVQHLAGVRHVALVGGGRVKTVHKARVGIGTTFMPKVTLVHMWRPIRRSIQSNAARWPWED